MKPESAGVGPQFRRLARNAFALAAGFDEILWRDTSAAMKDWKSRQSATPSASSSSAVN